MKTVGNFPWFGASAVRSTPQCFDNVNLVTRRISIKPEPLILRRSLLEHIRKGTKTRFIWKTAIKMKVVMAVGYHKG